MIRNQECYVLKTNISTICNFKSFHICKLQILTQNTNNTSIHNKTSVSDRLFSVYGF